VQLRDHENQFREHGANLAVGLGDAEYARAFRHETGIRFPLLIDEQRRAYRVLELKKGSLLHLLRIENVIGRRRARAAGHRQPRLGKNPFQLGGTFIFGPGNVDRFAHISQTFSDNATPQQILTSLG